MLSCVEGGINTDPYSKIVHKNGSLVVSVPACGSSDPSSSLTRCTIFGSTSVNHETFRDIRSACREGGIGAAVGESRTIPRYVSCCQSRTFPMYIAFWQLHSHLYLENSRVLWDSAVSGSIATHCLGNCPETRCLTSLRISTRS